MVRLRLYIAGQTRSSLAALTTVHELCDAMPGIVDVEIVDIVEDPDAAEENRVLATPTLDRVEPWPTRRMIGDLQDLDRIVETFELGDTDTSGATSAVADDGVSVTTGDVSVASGPTVAMDAGELRS